MIIARNKSDFRMSGIFHQDLTGIIRGTIIPYIQMEVGSGLSQNTVDLLFYISGTIISTQKNCNFRDVHSN